MSGYRIVLIQASSASLAQAAPAAPQAPAVPEARAVPTREQIRNQIRQSIQDATRAAAEASGENVVTIRDGRPVIAGDARNGPGITIHRSGMEDVIPPQAVDISIAFFIMLAVIIIGWPLARAMGRRLERRADMPALPDAAIAGQLQRIEQAVEAMSIEIERISESQRFMAKLQGGAVADRSALGGGERR